MAKEITLTLRLSGIFFALLLTTAARAEKWEIIDYPSTYQLSSSSLPAHVTARLVFDLDSFTSGKTGNELQITYFYTHAGSNFHVWMQSEVSRKDCGVGGITIVRDTKQGNSTRTDVAGAPPIAHVWQSKGTEYQDRVADFVCRVAKGRGTATIPPQGEKWVFPERLRARIAYDSNSLLEDRTKDAVQLTYISDTLPLSWNLAQVSKKDCGVGGVLTRVVGNTKADLTKSAPITIFWKSKGPADDDAIADLICRQATRSQRRQ